MSQRTDNFKAGIQAGQTAYDDASKAMDVDCKMASKELEEELRSLGYHYNYKIEKELKEQYNIFVGCEPDGGAWFDSNGKLVLVCEGKKQGTRGNAIERWSKNYMIATRLNPDVRYVTFGRGPGFAEDEYCYRFAKTFMEPGQEFNVLYPKGASWFIKVDGFTRQELVDIIRKAVMGDFT